MIVVLVRRSKSRFRKPKYLIEDALLLLHRNLEIFNTNFTDNFVVLKIFFCDTKEI